MIYDLSPPISSALAVWPGDTVPSREVLCDMADGSNITLSTLHSTVHAGAHADGPNHYGADAPAIDQRSLEYYLGPAQVVRVKAAPSSRIGIDAMPSRLDATRVLIATGTYPDPTSFREDFAAVEPALVDHLHERGVCLIGIDTPSVDVFTSEDLPTHGRFLANDMAILEGLVLAAVPEGVYELIALPLRLAGFDGSPVRAILRSLETVR